jgi:hypothetical protein
MLSHRIALLGSLACAACAACASSETTPGAMSAARHDAVAHEQEYEARQDFARYHPAEAEVNCRPPEYNACWDSQTNPTEDWLQQARIHMQLAEAHRAASKALRDAEARACAGLPAHDRDISPFAHRTDITRSHSILSEDGTRYLGADVDFRARPGMTAGYLQRVVDCQLARDEAVDHDVPEMSYCPLVPKGAWAKVTAIADGLEVTIQSPDEDGATEIARRARALVAPRPR